MIHLLPIRLVLSYVAAAYAFVIAMVALSLSGAANQSSLSGATLAFSGLLFLQSIFLIWIYFGWRRLWRWIPQLNGLFPDLNGEWEMDINYSGSHGNGTVKATATIHQNFLNITMEVNAPGSDSFTLATQPSREKSSAIPVLYYIYEVTRRHSGQVIGHSYKGSALLRYFQREGGVLRGNYWTEDASQGEFVLVRRLAKPRRPIRAPRPLSGS